MKRLIPAVMSTLLTGLYATSALATATGGAGGGAGAAQPSGTPGELFTGSNPIFQTISEILIFLTGAIAVIVIIFGGLRYVTSTGDAGRVKSAKDTIMYGIVGVVVAILAYALVEFVTDSLT